MKNIAVLVIALVSVSSMGFAQKKGAVPDTIKHVTFYTCSMHSDVHADKPGKCPKCGMALNLSTKEQAKASEMKNYICPIHTEETSHDPAKCPKCGKKMNLSSKEQGKAASMKLYTCPMHPDVALNKDGVCPKCGKQLKEKVQQKTN